ncbi:glutaredoxin 3 [Thalassotalea sediminis]|uniref:glutaredoxin 3 n=1 Tax=Thalassotalea sediminis TaxID=1759089 RepID=UPI003D9B1C9F
MAIEIYTKVTCGFCMRAKMLLDQKKVAYQEIKIDGNAALREKMIERANGAYTVPQIFIHGHHVGGCDELYALHARNELDALLAKA